MNYNEAYSQIWALKTREQEYLDANESILRTILWSQVSYPTQEEWGRVIRYRSAILNNRILLERYRQMARLSEELKPSTIEYKLKWYKDYIDPWTTIPGGER